MKANPELLVIIPVFNEEEHISDLIGDWEPVFAQTGTPYQIIVIDDGSNDHSMALLRAMQEKDPHLVVYSQSNAGHGPAILKGYRIALAASWVFQIDGDNQYDTAAFRTLWESRNIYDFLLAERMEKNASLSRHCVSRLSRLIVHLLYGRQVRDVNSPYRLMRSAALGEALDKIPPGSFAPNILLTAWFAGKKKRIFTTSVNRRKTDNARRSKMNRYFLSGSLQAACQTILFRFRL
jgi:glycosyltransferase involved in cell wall biosynthesis